MGSKSKIWLLGDSFVSGEACAAENKNLSGHLQKFLDKNNIDQNVINLGVLGKTLANYIDFLETFEIHKDDTIFLILYDNDIHLSEEVCRLSLKHNIEKGIFVPHFCKEIDLKLLDTKDRNSFIKKINYLVKEIYIIKLLKESLYQFKSFRKFFYRSEYRNLWFDNNSPENKLIVEQIVYIEKLAKQFGAKFILTYYPNTNAINEGDVRHKIWTNFFEYLLNEKKIKGLDPYPYFIDKSTSKNMVWSLTDKHPNCEAHGIFAKFLLESIQ